MMTETWEAFLIPRSVPTFAFVLTRVSGLMMTAPMWSMGGTPRTLRAAVTMLLTIALLPAAPRVGLPDPLVALPAGLALEMMVGVLIGLTAAVFVQGAAMAGEVVSMQMGLSLGPAFSPMTDVLVPGVGQFKTMLAIMIYLAVGGHLVLLQGVAHSLREIPPGSGLSAGGAVDVAAHLLGTVYRTAIQASAPVLVSLFLVNIAVGIASRAVPQLPAILVLFPVTVGVGLIVLGFAVPMLAEVLNGWMSALPEHIARALEAFKGAP
jgi:flagellar biosynthetic protein FliR